MSPRPITLAKVLAAAVEGVGHTTMSEEEEETGQMGSLLLQHTSVM
jgi:hypothetical protein